MEKDKSFKFTVGFAFKILGYLTLLVYVAFMAFGKFIFNAGSIFWRSINIFGTAGEYDAVLRIISYAIFFLSASWIIRFALKYFSKYINKGKAVIDLICSLIKYAAVIILLFFALKTCGVNTSAILAGIGIIGLIVGLGAQPLIADIIAGFFIVF